MRKVPLPPPTLLYLSIVTESIIIVARLYCVLHGTQRDYFTKTCPSTILANEVLMRIMNRWILSGEGGLQYPLPVDNSGKWSWFPRSGALKAVGSFQEKRKRERETMKTVDAHFPRIVLLNISYVYCTWGYCNHTREYTQLDGFERRCRRIRIFDPKCERWIYFRIPLIGCLEFGAGATVQFLELIFSGSSR